MLGAEPVDEKRHASEAVGLIGAEEVNNAITGRQSWKVVEKRRGEWVERLDAAGYAELPCRHAMSSRRKAARSRA